jgi:peptidoglycan/LPS O-acetylase OafA/YrhL
LKSQRLYLPQLDVMRFYAFLSVFLIHGLPSPVLALHTGADRAIALAELVIERSGESGVALFFLLSAYLITELLRREKDVSGSVHLQKFYIRRALRIWPLYYLVLVIGLVLSATIPSYRLGWTDVLTYVFFVKNWDIVFRGWLWNPIFILWTVSAEEQFYVVWPFAQKMFNKRSLMVLCVAAMIAIPLLVFQPDWVLVRHGVTQQIFTFIYFPIGSMIALVLEGRRRQVGAVTSLAMLAAGLALWLVGSYLVIGDGASGVPLATLILGKFVILLGTVVTFFAFFWSDPKLALRPLIYLGKISFGLYVFHVMVIYGVEWCAGRLGFPATGHLSYVIVNLGLALALTIVTATLSYEFYEKRFLVLKDRFAIVHSRAV